MRSLLLVCNLNPMKFGTYEIYLCELGRRCRAAGVRCGLVLAGEPIPEVAADLRMAGVEWWTIPDWNDESDRERRWEFIRGYMRVLRQGPWDVAVYQFCHELTVCSVTLRGRLRGIAPKSAVWVQHSGMLMPRRVAKYLSRLRLLAWFVKGMVVLDPAARAAVVARGWPPSHVTVIGNGCAIPSNPRRLWLRPELGLSANTVLLISVGSLIERKGYDLLIPAVAPLLAGRYDRHLLLIGDGPLKAELESLALAHGISKQVHFLGLRNDVPDMLADSDVFVLSSRAEGLSLAVVEALAASLPVVATDVGGHREVITERTGYLVPPENVEAFRDAVSKVLDDLPAARLRGLSAREYVKRELSIKKQVEDQFRYFESIPI
jgi:glycosyltransferase involved in cell wall biosynthesis